MVWVLLTLEQLKQLRPLASTADTAKPFRLSLPQLCPQLWYLKFKVTHMSHPEIPPGVSKAINLIFGDKHAYWRLIFSLSYTRKIN